MTLQKIEEMISEIKQYGGLSPNEMQIVENALTGFLDRCHNRFRYYDYFTIATGKNYGDALEEKIRESFLNFTKPINDTSFDAISSSGEKIEIKSLRACSQGQEIIFLKGDCIPASKFSTSSYQQTKPSCCDWFIYHIMYGDGSRLFLIPSSMISQHPGKAYAEPGKIPLSIQHRDHETEGQVNLGQVIKYAQYFEIPEYELEKSYDFENFKRIIISRMEAIKWRLPR